MFWLKSGRWNIVVVVVAIVVVVVMVVNDSGQIGVSKTWDIADIDFVLVVVSKVIIIFTQLLLC